MTGYIALLECCDGNGEVGSMWFESYQCTAETTVGDIVRWKEKQRGAHGRLMLVKVEPVNLTSQ